MVQVTTLLTRAATVEPLDLGINTICIEKSKSRRLAVCANCARS